MASCRSAAIRRYLNVKALTAAARVFLGTIPIALQLEMADDIESHTHDSKEDAPLRELEAGRVDSR